MSEGMLNLRTIPAGSIIKRREQHPSGLPIFIEWEEPDGSLHLMRIMRDANSPVGLRVEEDSVTTSPTLQISVETIDPAS